LIGLPILAREAKTYCMVGFYCITIDSRYVFISSNHLAMCNEKGQKLRLKLDYMKVLQVEAIEPKFVQFQAQASPTVKKMTVSGVKPLMIQARSSKKLFCIQTFKDIKP